MAKTNVILREKTEKFYVGQRKDGSYVFLEGTLIGSTQNIWIADRYQSPAAMRSVLRSYCDGLKAIPVTLESKLEIGEPEPFPPEDPDDWS